MGRMHSEDVVTGQGPYKNRETNVAVEQALDGAHAGMEEAFREVLLIFESRTFTSPRWT